MVKQLLKSVREFKKDALLTPFFVVLEVVMEVLIPFVMAELIDKGIDAQNMSAIGKYGFILVACAMLALYSARRPAPMLRALRPALRAISDTICTMRCRTFRSPTSISSPPALSLPV